jgi:myb proto-oncogene protein
MTAHMNKKGKWTMEDDARMAEAVKKHGVSNWAAVAALVPGRTNMQCRQRWVESLDPDINTGKWTMEEDAKLTEAVKKQGKEWVAVAAVVPGRTNHQCRQRWLRSLDPNIDRTKGEWTAEEDAQLMEAV